MVSNNRVIMSKTNIRLFMVLFAILIIYLLPSMRTLSDYKSFVYEKYQYHFKLRNDDVPYRFRDNIIPVTRRLKNQLLKLFTPSPTTSNIAAAEEIEKMYPNLPILYWMKIRHKQDQMHYKNKSCAPFPDIFNLDIDKEYWQQVYLSNGTVIQAYSAHYDDRFENETIVRIIAMSNKTESLFFGNVFMYCQLWFENENEPVVRQMNKTRYMYFHGWDVQDDGEFGPYLLGCSIPKSHKHKIPVMVTVVEHFCDTPRIMLKVLHERAVKKKEFGVCVKGLDFLQKDVSYKLIELIEFLFIMGVDKIFFYQLEVHPQVQIVLDYYVKLNRIEVRQTTISSRSPALRFIQHIYLQENVVIQMFNEAIQYNDCFYRNINNFEYLSMLDTDEVIVPLMDRNWHDMIERMKKRQDYDTILNSFTARNIYFLDIFQKNESYPGIPSYTHMLKGIYRAQNFTEIWLYPKSIVSTKHVISVHNHLPLEAVPGTVQDYFLDEEARLQHYRFYCNEKDNCSDYSTNTVKDTKMWDFKDELIPNINRAIVNMGLLIY